MSELEIRQAKREDLPQILAMIQRDSVRETGARCLLTARLPMLRCT